MSELAYQNPTVIIQNIFNLILRSSVVMIAISGIK